MPYAMPGMMKKQMKVYTKREDLTPLGVSGHLAEEPGAVEGDLADNGDRVPDEDAEDVEEEVAQRNLPRLNGLEVTTVAAMMPVEEMVPMLAPRVSGSMSSRLMRPTAASRRVRVEVADGGGLHHDVDEHADDDVEVPVEADHLAEDGTDGAINDDLEHVHDAEEARAERDEGNDGEEGTRAVVGHVPVIEEEAALEEALVAEASLDLGAAHLVAGAGGEGAPRRCW